MNKIKVCLTLDGRLYKAFQDLYPHSLRQAVESLLRKAIYNDDFLWTFINEPDVRITNEYSIGPKDKFNFTVDDLRSVKNEENI